MLKQVTEGIYRVLGFASNSKKEEGFVLYERVEADARNEDGTPWARPMELFMEKFEEIEEQSDSLKFYNMPRASGKTHTIIDIMRKNSHAYCLVPNDRIRSTYPQDVRARVFNMNSRYLRDELSRRKSIIDKIYIDEGLLMQKSEIAYVFYHLGRMGIKTEVYGTW